MKAVDKTRLEMMAKELTARKKVSFDLNQFCFDKQVAFIRDPARYKTAVCSRRSGKSVTCSAHLVNQCLTTPKSTCLYITLTRTNAKKLVWREVCDIVRNYKLDAEVNNSELKISFSNGSIIYFSGASKKEEVEKFRGLSIHLAYLDEVQSFKPFVRELIDEVLAYAVLDVAGSICLIGTPAPTPAGYFYESAHSKGWSNHKWTIFDNPHIKLKTGMEPADLLAQERERRGITEDDPAYLREALGLWVQDDSSLVFRYNKQMNHYTTLPIDPLVYILGVDLGYNDADAIAVIGYSELDKTVYLVEEIIKEKQGITELAVQIQQMIDKYKPIKVKIDAGALGKKISEELIRRHNLPVEAAEKTRKIEFIELMNDDLRTGRLKIKNNSAAAGDMLLVQWDVKTKDKRTIASEPHSDILDALLYAWKEAKHYISERQVKKVVTEEQKIEKFWEEQEQKLKKVGGSAWWES